MGLLSFALAVLHPNHKARCLHSWLPALWLGAGIGLALILHGRLTRRLAHARPWLTGAAVVLLLSQCLGIWKLGHADEGGPKPARPSMLELTDYFLPDVEHAQRATVVAAVPCRFQVEWATMLRLG